jgi:hypothetical protein
MHWTETVKFSLVNCDQALVFSVPFAVKSRPQKGDVLAFSASLTPSYLLPPYSGELAVVCGTARAAASQADVIRNLDNGLCYPPHCRSAAPNAVNLTITWQRHRYAEAV